jgi:prophage regulatory protein
MQQRVISALKPFSASELERRIRQPEVLTLVPIGVSTLWKRIARGEFPAPQKYGPRLVAWRLGDVLNYLANPDRWSAANKSEDLESTGSA